jgi:Uncharacterized protein conserved in bacteria
MDNAIPLRVNIGCGRTPTADYKNYDNSPALFLAHHTALFELVKRLRLLDKHNIENIHYLRNCRELIVYANALVHIPETDNSYSCDVIYSCHMFEHLSPRRCRSFLTECHRCLKKGGILRLAIPDLKIMVDRYVESGDADRLMKDLFLEIADYSNFRSKLKMLLLGTRGHLWMYDGNSLRMRLKEAGFADITILPAGETTIPIPGALNLREREDASVYVEARK